MGAPRHFLTAISGLFAAGIAFGHSAAALAQAPITLRYAVDTKGNINELSQRLAEREGFFMREGLNLEIHRFVTTGNRAILIRKSVPGGDNRRIRPASSVTLGKGWRIH